MKFSEDIILENEKVKLVPLSMGHLLELTHYAEKEPELWKYTLDQPTSKSKMSAYIQKALEERSEQKSYAFVAIDKTSSRVAGCTRLYEIDMFHKNCSVGFTWYGKDFQGTGLNKISKYLLFEFAFEHLEIERVQFRADRNNLRSINAIKSLGCTEEGVLRSNMIKPDGERRDSVILSVLNSEWKDFAKEQLRSKISSL
jgi:N-acetyltransferase